MENPYFTNPFGFISLKKALAKASAFFLANDSNFDRNPLRGCNYGLEGGAFLILGGAFSMLGGAV